MLGQKVVAVRCQGSYSDANVSGRDSISHVLHSLWEEVGIDPLNPLEEYLSPGSCVVIKPNWVMDTNPTGHGLDCLVTNATVIAAAIEWCLRAMKGRGSIVVGDSPIQDCDLPKLMEAAGYGALKSRYASASVPVHWRDFRRATLTKSKGIWNRETSSRPMCDWVLFDLGSESLLEPIGQDADRFRVTKYDPDQMREAHSPGRHRYLIAREVVEADVIINLPKLKTHRKTCVTGSLKNLVGVNGNKDYLPHHRLGGRQAGGDCYAGGSRLKLAAELLSDAANRREGISAYLLWQAVRGSYGLARVAGADRNLEGNWYGNDTIWRTVLDLNRVVMYGQPEGTMSDLPQRRVLTLTDAVVCGEGEGPLQPDPYPLGMLTLADNSAAADYAHAYLMGFDWRRVPLIREAFGRFRFPLCTFGPEDVVVQLAGETYRQPWPDWDHRPFMPPEGWKGHCERLPHERGSEA